MNKYLVVGRDGASGLECRVYVEAHGPEHALAQATSRGMAQCRVQLDAPDPEIRATRDDGAKTTPTQPHVCDYQNPRRVVDSSRAKAFAGAALVFVPGLVLAVVYVVVLCVNMYALSLESLHEAERNAAANAMVQEAIAVLTLAGVVLGPPYAVMLWAIAKMKTYRYHCGGCGRYLWTS